MKIKAICREEFRTAKWSGGETTEMYIYPSDGSYAERNFTIRISSAHINSESSVFTKLPQVKRWIMPIEGSIILEHNGERKVELKPYSVDKFSGEDNTESKGKGRDFNLMIKGSVDGALYAVSPDEVNSIALQKNVIYAFYSMNEIRVDRYVVNMDRLIVFEEVLEEKIINILGKGKLIIAEIYI